MNKRGRKTIRWNFREAIWKFLCRTKANLFAPALLLLGLILSLSFVWVPPSSAQSNPAFIRLVRVMKNDQTGLLSPAGLAFSSKANAFHVIEKHSVFASTRVIKLTAFAEMAGSAWIGAIQNPINVAFDNKMGRLLILQSSANQLLELRERRGRQSGPAHIDPLRCQEFWPAKPPGVNGRPK